MIEQLTPLWSEAVRKLVRDSNDDSLAAWMKEARPVSVDDDCLIVQVPNKFTRDWVSMRYGAALRSTLEQLSGRMRDVRFVLPDAAPVPAPREASPAGAPAAPSPAVPAPQAPNPDRKSTRLNSSHVKISYAVFCL